MADIFKNVSHVPWSVLCAAVFYLFIALFIAASVVRYARKEEGASYHARRGKNAEAFLNLLHRAILVSSDMRSSRKVKSGFIVSTISR